MDDDIYRNTLDALAQKSRLRTLAPAQGLDFTSNDYLALTRHAAVRGAVAQALADGMEIGAGGSRLLRGNHPAIADLEATAADVFGAERALYMSSGYLANVAIMTSLPQRGDAILFDELIHASAKEGIHASHAKGLRFAHNAAGAAEDALKRWRKTGRGRAWIAVESIYSMDGDTAPLADLVDVAARHDAMLVVDEAHATGVHGDGGRGFTAAYEGADNLVVLHTCGKGLGAAGALVTAPALLVDYVVNRCRSFIYSTAPSPLMAVAVKAALGVVAAEPERRRALADLAAHANRRLEAETGTAGSGSQIVPYVVGADADAVALADALQAEGFDVRAIRPPTVPEGTARLRIAVTLNVTQAEVDQLMAAIGARRRRDVA